MKRYTSILLVLASAQIVSAAHILIYTKNGKGYVHKNIAASVACLEGICQRNSWSYEVSDDPNLFTTAKIKTFNTVVFTNTNNEAFGSNDQRDVFQSYIRNGGGFVGIHSACGSERQWPWFWAMLGGKFKRHPKFQPFDIKVIDRQHPSTQHLPPVWAWEDEFYLLHHMNPDLHVLLAGDLSTIKDDKLKEFPGDIFGHYFPLAWCHEFDGGRQWYTALGHKDEHYADPNLIKHIEGGIRWTLPQDSQHRTK